MRIKFDARVQHDWGSVNVASLAPSRAIQAYDDLRSHRFTE